MGKSVYQFSFDNLNTVADVGLSEEEAPNLLRFLCLRKRQGWRRVDRRGWAFPLGSQSWCRWRDRWPVCHWLLQNIKSRRRFIKLSNLPLTKTINMPNHIIIINKNASYRISWTSWTKADVFAEVTWLSQQSRVDSTASSHVTMPELACAFPQSNKQRLNQQELKQISSVAKTEVTMTTTICAVRSQLSHLRHRNQFINKESHGINGPTLHCRYVSKLISF